ncbi:MAG: bacillithiol biosynthesis cysteine-adding enzyme BshC [Gemmatimonadota bacterium]
MIPRLIRTPIAEPPRAIILADRSSGQDRPSGFATDLFGALVSADGTGAAVEKLRRPDALVVTTGQQPGLFTGPLYTVYKALSAAALAAALERRWHRPVVPLFWLAGDDHDFAEANHTSWLAADGTLRNAELRKRAPDEPLTPMYRELLGDDVNAALAKLEADLPPSEFRESTVDWLRRHYRETATVASAFGAAMAELLAPLGILCFDSTHAAAKRAAAPVLLAALDQAGELDRRLVTRVAELRTEGVDAGVAVGEQATLVMLEASAGRDRLIATAGGFVTRRSGERFTREALARIAAEEPQRLSPNVLLRPIVESASIPTVAYAGGPGELRYLRLAEVLYQPLKVPPQQPVPRWSGLLVEARVDRVLEKFGATLEELLAGGGHLEARLVRSQLPDDATAALAKLRAAIEREYGTLGRAAAGIDPTIEKPVLNARNQALAGTQDVEKRLVQHLKKRQEVELGQVARAREAVLPGGKPQERVLTLAPWLARSGPMLLQELLADMKSWYDAGLEGVPVPS